MNDKLLKTNDNHSHPPQKENIKVCEKVKQKVINEITSILRVYDEECEKGKLANAAIVILPSEHEMSTRDVTIPIPFGIGGYRY